MRQALILAGGKGTRLRECVGDLPKPLVDIVGMPLLERQILLAKQYGFRDILVLVNYAAERIVEFCAARGNWGLNVKCIDDGEPRGTAGATLAVMELLADEFLVIYGDTMLNVDLSRFVAFHEARPAASATLLVHPNDHPRILILSTLTKRGASHPFTPIPTTPSTTTLTSSTPRSIAYANLRWSRGVTPWGCWTSARICSLRCWSVA